MKLIHKDQEVIPAFCMNSCTETQLCVATHKELLEMDISSLLNPPVWLDDDSDDESSNR